MRGRMAVLVFLLDIPQVIRLQAPFMSLLRAEGIWKAYDVDGRDVQVLLGADLEVGEGEFVVVRGASGSGKSTLLHILGGLDRPLRGGVAFRGQSVYEQREVELARFRNREVGFIFQFYHLLPELTARENVMLPCLIGGVSRKEAGARADELLSLVGMAPRAAHVPQQLSGGEQQRVAMARAVAQRPRLLLADEPTGNLDATMGAHVMQLLRTVWREQHMAVVMVTHNRELMDANDRQLELRSGVLHAV